MSMFSSRISIPLRWAVLAVFSMLICILALLFLVLVPDKKWFSDDGYAVVIVTGLIPGLVVALFQYLLQWKEYSEISRLSSMKIKEVLVSRDDESLYGSIIENASSKIDVLGVTCSRLLADFAVEGSPKREKQALIKALERGVSVRILIASVENLTDPDTRAKYEIALRRLRELSEKYAGKFECRIYCRPPSQSVFVADDECLVGPKLPNIASRNTPTIHTEKHSVFAKPYIEFFEQEWISASGLK